MASTLPTISPSGQSKLRNGSPFFRSDQTCHPGCSCYVEGKRRGDGPPGPSPLRCGAAAAAPDLADRHVVVERVGRVASIISVLADQVDLPGVPPLPCPPPPPPA